MDSAWLMAICTGVCNAGVAVAGKGAERARCRFASYGLVVFAVAGATAYLTTVGGHDAWGAWRLWAFGGTMGALYLVAVASMLHANRYWQPSIVWSAANMAFVAPILLSALFLGEPLRWIDGPIFAGVALMLAGLTEREPTDSTDASRTESRPAARMRWPLLATVFVVNGILMFGFKLFAVVLPGQRPACLVAVIYGCGAALALLAQAVRGALRINRSELAWGLGSGVASSLAALAMLAAMRLPAAAAFPIVQGTSLAGGVLLCAIVFRERITPRKFAALAIGLGALVLPLWR